MSHITHSLSLRERRKPVPTSYLWQTQVVIFGCQAVGRHPPTFCCFLVDTSILKANDQEGPFVEVALGYWGSLMVSHRHWLWLIQVKRELTETMSRAHRVEAAAQKGQEPGSSEGLEAGIAPQRHHWSL